MIERNRVRVPRESKLTWESMTGIFPTSTTTTASTKVTLIMCRFFFLECLFYIWPSDFWSLFKTRQSHWRINHDIHPIYIKQFVAGFEPGPSWTVVVLLTYIIKHLLWCELLQNAGFLHIWVKYILGLYYKAFTPTFCAPKFLVRERLRTPEWKIYSKKCVVTQLLHSTFVLVFFNIGSGIHKQS